MPWKKIGYVWSPNYFTPEGGEGYCINDNLEEKKILFGHIIHDVPARLPLFDKDTQELMLIFLQARSGRSWYVDISAGRLMLFGNKFKNKPRSPDFIMAFPVAEKKEKKYGGGKSSGDYHRDFYGGERSYGSGKVYTPAFCSVLGIEYWPCTLLDVKRAYRLKALETHPDRGGTQDEFVQVNDAYQQAVSALGTEGRAP